jgi:hypothetical protein
MPCDKKLLRREPEKEKAGRQKHSEQVNAARKAIGQLGKWVGSRSHGVVVVVSGGERSVHLWSIRHDHNEDPQMQHDAVHNHHQTRRGVPACTVPSEALLAFAHTSATSIVSLVNA